MLSHLSEPTYITHSFTPQQGRGEGREEHYTHTFLQRCPPKNAFNKNLAINILFLWKFLHVLYVVQKYTCSPQILHPFWAWGLMKLFCFAFRARLFVDSVPVHTLPNHVILKLHDRFITSEQSAMWMTSHVQVI